MTRGPYITTGVRSRASKEYTAGAAPDNAPPASNQHGWHPGASHHVSTQGAIPASVSASGVAIQAITPHPAVQQAIADAQQHPAAARARLVQRTQIANVQRGLMAAGHNPGSTNGELDYQTRAALRSFQANHSLPVTGTIDGATHAAVTGGASETGTGKRAGRPEALGAHASMGPINHAAAKGAPVVRLATHLPPIHPKQVPIAGTVHPSHPAPPRSSFGPQKPTPPAKFRNSFPGHLGGKPGQLGQHQVSFPPRGAQHAGPSSGSQQGMKAPPGGTGFSGPSGPPQGAGASPPTSQAIGFSGGHGHGPGGAAAGDTGGRHGGFRPGGSAGRKAQGGMASAQTQGSTHMANKGNTKGWRSTGWRICLVLTATITGGSNAAISVNPQMDFRGENLVIDTTTVGPSSTLTIPSIGTIPQIAGGTASTAVPGTLFSPAQAGALDFKMSIANQGNAVSFTANNTNTTVTLSFAALLFGTEVEMDQSGGMTTGVAPAGAYTGG